MDKKILPDKLSETIRLALEDLRKCEKDPRYVIEMWEGWHDPILVAATGVSSQCQVCFAGAVMANTLGCSPETCVYSDDFDHLSRQKLNALDCVRTGQMAAALDYFYDMEEDEADRQCDRIGMEAEIGVVDYHEDRNKWYEQMLSIAYDLEKVGL